MTNPNTFEHPLQLFSLKYPESWEPRYSEETGSVMVVNTSTREPTAVSFSPLAVTGEGFDVAAEVVTAAGRMCVTLRPEDVRPLRIGEAEAAYGEGSREDDGTHFRFWVLRRGPLAIYAAQLGPGVRLDSERATAEEILASLSYPEVMPPTPEQFRERVLEVLAREYTHLRAEPSGQWGVELSSAEGERIGTVGLENLYRSSLLNSESAGAMIRDYVDRVLGSMTVISEMGDWDSVRDRLLPVLKSISWVNEIPGGSELLTVEFAEKLVLCFVIDEPTRMAFVRREMAEQWDLPVERIQEVALDHLAARSEELQIMGLPGEDGRACALIINSQDGYDATRLALPTVRDTFAEALGDEYLVGLPNRDFLVAFSDRNSELAAGIIRQVRQDYHQMDHPITGTIYRVRADRVEPADV